MCISEPVDLFGFLARFVVLLQFRIFRQEDMWSVIFCATSVIVFWASFVLRRGLPRNRGELVPLTPEYLAEEHDGYVAAIEAALANEQVRNIALSGSYRVGKSSIMQEVALRQDSRIVELSLSTLALIEAFQLDDSVPAQAKTPTDCIQQEIVKQLLYREYPSRTPSCVTPVRCSVEVSHD